MSLPVFFESLILDTFLTFEIKISVQLLTLLQPRMAPPLTDTPHQEWWMDTARLHLLLMAIRTHPHPSRMGSTKARLLFPAIWDTLIHQPLEVPSDEFLKWMTSVRLVSHKSFYMYQTSRIVSFFVLGIKKIFWNRFISSNQIKKKPRKI